MCIPGGACVASLLASRLVPWGICVARQRRMRGRSVLSDSGLPQALLRPSFQHCLWRGPDNALSVQERVGRERRLGLGRRSCQAPLWCPSCNSTSL